MRPGRPLSCYLGLVMDHRFGDVPLDWGFKSPSDTFSKRFYELGLGYPFPQITLRAREGPVYAVRTFRHPATSRRIRKTYPHRQTKTGAIRYALRQVLQAKSLPSATQREERLTRFLEEAIWPLIPPDQLGKPASKAEREEILGFGQDGA
jgi:antitoxin VapB